MGSGGARAVGSTGCQRQVPSPPDGPGAEGFAPAPASPGTPLPARPRQRCPGYSTRTLRRCQPSPQTPLEGAAPQCHQFKPSLRRFFPSTGCPGAAAKPSRLRPAGAGFCKRHWPQTFPGAVESSQHPGRRVPPRAGGPTGGRRGDNPAGCAQPATPGRGGAEKVAGKHPKTQEKKIFQSSKPQTLQQQRQQLGNLHGVGVESSSSSVRDPGAVNRLLQPGEGEAAPGRARRRVQGTAGSPPIPSAALWAWR